MEPEVQITNSKQQNQQFNNNCSLRIKIRFCEEKIYLNRDHYKELSDYLLDEKEHKHLCTIYEQIIPSTERSHLVHSLLRFYVVKNKLVEMLKSFLLTEIDRCADLSTLFRPATMSTSLRDQYMRTRCDEFLRKSLEEPLVTKILKLNQNNNNIINNIKSFELDPIKCKDANQRETNLVNFQTALKELINSICNQNSVNLFPNELKHIFYLIRQHVHLKWKKQQCDDTNNSNTTTDDKLVRIYCVSAFVFLRLLCPALLNPKNFGLKFYDYIDNSSSNKQQQQQQQQQQTQTTKFKNVLNYIDLANQFCVFSPEFMFSLMPPSESINKSHRNDLNSNSSNSSNSNSASSQQLASIYERHIKLLAKVLQTLANMTECKEPFMLPLSDFLNVNKQNVIKFIEDISNLNELNLTHVIKLNEQEDDNNNDNKLNIQFENASYKYLAILFRLLNSFLPQIKSYLEKSPINKSTDHTTTTTTNNLMDNKQERMFKQDDETNFIASLQRLYNILIEISKKTK